jgi:hypothetical protein
LPDGIEAEEDGVAAVGDGAGWAVAVVEGEEAPGATEVGIGMRTQPAVKRSRAANGTVIILWAEYIKPLDERSAVTALLVLQRYFTLGKSDQMSGATLPCNTRCSPSRKQHKTR